MDEKKTEQSSKGKRSLESLQQDRMKKTGMSVGELGMMKRAKEAARPQPMCDSFFYPISKAQKR
jgi:hypothetical protein